MSNSTKKDFQLCVHLNWPIPICFRDVCTQTGEKIEKNTFNLIHRRGRHVSGQSSAYFEKISAEKETSQDEWSADKNFDSDQRTSKKSAGKTRHGAPADLHTVPVGRSAQALGLDGEELMPV
jgi:hypothetical protein